MANIGQAKLCVRFLESVDVEVLEELIKRNLHTQEAARIQSYKEANPHWFEKETNGDCSNIDDSLGYPVRVR